MSQAREFFSIIDISNQISGSEAETKFIREITVKTDEIAREAIESVRGTSRPIDRRTTPGTCTAYTCDVCNETTASPGGYAPLFCSRCGRLFNYAKEEA